jgi:hypothetical protein
MHHPVHSRINAKRAKTQSTLPHKDFLLICARKILKFQKISKKSAEVCRIYASAEVRKPVRSREEGQ